jgi:hypothetical protein
MFFFYIDYWISALIFIKRVLEIPKNRSPYFSQNLAWKPAEHKINTPEALKSLYRSPGYKKNQLVLCKNYVLLW